MPVNFALAALAVVLLVAAPSGRAQELAASPDTTIEYGVIDVTVRDENVLLVTVATIGIEDLGPLPPEADVTGFGMATNGLLFSLATGATLPGPVTVRPRDVVRWDGATYTIDVDGAVAGIPRGVRIDAVSASGTDWILSFDTSADLGGGVVVEDEDLVLWNGSVFTLAFDGSAEGLARELDVDAVHGLGGGDYLLSLDTSADVSGVFVNDEDLLRFESGVGFSLELDTSTLDADWEGTDLVAVPEPSWWLGILGGVALLARLGRGRVARRHRR